MSFVVGYSTDSVGGITAIGGNKNNGRIFKACIANVMNRSKEAHKTTEEIKNYIITTTEKSSAQHKENN